MSEHGSQFSFETQKEFDKHISQSVSSYDALNQLVINIASYFVHKGSNVLDVGCTSGKLLYDLNDKYPESNYYGVDVVDVRKYQGYKFINMDILDIQSMAIDNRKLLPDEIPFMHLVFSVFTMQFIKRENKYEYLQRLHSFLKPGGALILCEKTISSDGLFQEIFNFCHYDQKRESFTDKDILDKQKVLRSIMFCETEDEIVDRCLDIGFKQVSRFFQSLSFKGWILIK